MPIFQIRNKRAKQIKVSSFKDEKELQTFIENNLKELLGVRFLTSEYSTGEKHGGRIDTLGIDENCLPVVIEYKWGEKEDIIPQGLFYLDWLLDHPGDFEKLVHKKYPEIKVKWDQPRLILIASSFSKYDKHAVNRIAENIELRRYLLYENGIFLMEDVYVPKGIKGKVTKVTKIGIFTVKDHLRKSDKETQQLFYDLQEKILDLGDVTEKPTKYYIGYWTNKLFCALHLYRHKLRVDIRVHGGLDDPEKLANKTPEEYGWGKDHFTFVLTPKVSLKNAIYLIKQAHGVTL